jgi:hypothetical protein
MTTNKRAKPLAPAKDWRNRPTPSWNVTTFTEYLKDEHKRIYGVDYAPMRSWGIEQGMLGDLIGTQARTNPKPRTVSNELVKRFIDECFASYTPNAQYPGTSFGFSFAYRKNVLQRLQLEEQAQARRKKAIESSDNDNWDEVSEWL